MFKKEKSNTTFYCSEKEKWLLKSHFFETFFKILTLII